MSDNQLPDATVAELVTLAVTCPASNVQALLPRLERVLAELRHRLTEVIAEAYREARAAEEWIASLEALAEAELAVASA
ncbi:hypothetical protein ACFXJ8_39375 [Nonomuraea sp. NPDC059194]|uniref:hypothetical protein n=1 Tax=Nonomuraea sp. NPDC059194 TaxID=3346764 RepID=UPI0036C8B864